MLARRGCLFCQVLRVVHHQGLRVLTQNAEDFCQDMVVQHVVEVSRIAVAAAFVPFPPCAGMQRQDLVMPRQNFVAPPPVVAAAVVALGHHS